MVEKDKSMEAMIANDQEKEWMTPLLEFRNEFGNEDGDRERRSFRRMKGNLQIMESFFMDHIRKSSENNGLNDY